MVATVQSPYGFGIRLQVPYAEAVERTKAALKEQGIGVLTEIDVRATLKQKLDVDYQPYVILGACNPSLAHRAITADPSVGLLLPCNVVLREVSTGTRVEFADPMSMLQLIDNATVREVAQEARDRIDRVAQQLSSGEDENAPPSQSA